MEVRSGGRGMVEDDGNATSKGREETQDEDNINLTPPMPPLPPPLPLLPSLPPPPPPPDDRGIRMVGGFEIKGRRMRFQMRGGQGSDARRGGNTISILHNNRPGLG